MTTYSVWDRSTGRLIGSFADEDLARAVASTINADGPVNETLALVHVEEQGLSQTLAVGPSLEELAKLAVSAARPSSGANHGSGRGPATTTPGPRVCQPPGRL